MVWVFCGGVFGWFVFGINYEGFVFCLFECYEFAIGDVGDIVVDKLIMFCIEKLGDVEKLGVYLLFV